MGMHNFGEKRFGNGLLDDFRSTNDQNTRIIGDFTKMVRQPRIAERMLELIKTDNWRIHFCKLVDDSKFPSLNELDPIVPKLRVALQWHANNARKFKRQTLQTRFFETGDNFYLGMEFTREYDKWKNETADALLASLNQKSMNEVEKKNFEQLKGTLMHHIDRLWYEACLEVIRLGDVYNPGARKRVPKLYIINSYAATQLVDLPVGESFRLDDKQDEKYEVLVKERNQILARNVEGYIFKMDEKTMVLREGNLTRGPDGNKESKVALATFPVGHYVNFRTVRLNNNARGYVFAFIGDEQSTPHFMRYSGLTGACINAMLVNEFVKKSFDGVPFMSRFATYAKETNWTNSEVVTRGTGSYYGRDGFLRPGFPYKDGIDYLHSKVIECMETGQDLNDILSRDWKGKFAAALIPKGMELNHAFISTFFEKTNDIIFNILVEEVKKDTRIQQKGLAEMLQSRNISLAEERSLMNHDSYWSHLSATIINSVDESTHKYLKDHHIEIAKRTEQTLIQIVEFARDGYHSDDRIVSEMVRLRFKMRTSMGYSVRCDSTFAIIMQFHQPKPVDAIVDDFAVEAQLFAGSLVMSASFAATSVALLLYEDQSMQEDGIGSIVGFILSVLSIIISFGTMTSVSRYKIRNEEARILFFEEKLPGVLKSVFAFLSKTFQDDVPDEINPFVVDLERKVEKFRDYANYYGVEELEKSGFNDAYNKLRQNVNDPFAIKDFQWQLAGKYIADIYHHNSYVQEYLVDVYKVCSDMLELLEQDEDRSRYAESSEHLFRRLTNFIPRLDKSLQRGHIYWGFLKHRRFVHWDIAVVFRYFWSLLWYASDATTKPLAPIQTETLGIIREARNVSANYHNTILRREIRDLEQLYWATRESDVSSLIFGKASLHLFLSFTTRCVDFLTCFSVTVVFVHILSWIFTISRILTFLGGPDDVTDASALASIGSTFGAILGALHFHRKLSILLRLWSILGGKVRTAKTSDDAASIKKVKDVTSSQILVTFFHFLAALAASIALPWSIFVAKEDDEGAKAKLAFLVALSSTAFATLALILVFIIEYRVRYDLSPRLGEYICEAFRDEIESMYTVLSKPMNDIETKQMQERETWEYVAREFLHKYRFDTVFAADRFGSILQYLQSGMDPRNSK